MSETSEIRRIAVVGASSDRHKYGNKCVRAYRRAGWEVFPINPRGGEIEGLPAISSVADAPDRLDRISVYLPPQVTYELIPQLAERTDTEIWLNPGSSNAAVAAAARAAGLRVVDGCSIVDIGLSPAQFPA